MIQNKINEVIRTRQSVFPPQYSDQPVAKEFIQTLLENANCAPNHKKTEPWRFKVFHSEKSRMNLGNYLADTYTDITNNENFSPFKHKKIKNNCGSSQAVIAICMQRDPKERIPEWEEIAAVSMAVQNMWLTCTAHGVGCYWSSPGLIKYMEEFLELNSGEKCLGFFYLGNYDDEEEDKTTRKPIGDKVRWM